jgi:leucyl-tRNA synthetase
MNRPMTRPSLLHRTIAGVREELDNLRFNTAIAKLIECNNHLTKLGGCPADMAEPLVQDAGPAGPHLAEELWAKLGHADSLTYEAFPVADPALLVEDTIEYPVQVNGKVRSRITVPPMPTTATMQAARWPTTRWPPPWGATPRRSSSSPAAWSTSSPDVEARAGTRRSSASNSAEALRRLGQLQEQALDLFEVEAALAGLRRGGPGTRPCRWRAS